MRIFRQKVVIDSAIEAREAWRRLLPLVRTNLPLCAACGQTMAGAGLVRFCSHCGQLVPPPLPQTWAERNSSSGGFEFEGDLSPQGFNISPIFTYTYRNSCYPIIRGRFGPRSNVRPSTTPSRRAAAPRRHETSRTKGWRLGIY